MICALPVLSRAAADEGAPAGFRPATEHEFAHRFANGHVIDADIRGETPDWMVSRDGDRLRVESRKDWLDRMRDKNQRPPYNQPPKITINVDTAKAFWWPGQGLRVRDGWLLNVDIGEWGGGIYLIDPNGNGYRQITERNTPIMEKMPQGIFAIESLSHLMFWYADLVEVRREKKGWTTRRITDLHVSPYNVIRSGNGFIYSTNEFISALETDGSQREIFRPLYTHSFSSMVRLPSGPIWLGDPDGLLRLTPKPNGEYDAQWYLPEAKPKPS